ncbi:MAG TPA: acyl-CoA dehydrogenase family protein, partial [Pseudomonadales bacterium]|nr:acyl-CoA dehydrogenase family protein [Pseudomonadales bacterium]
MNYLLTQDQRDFQTLLERFLKSKVDSLFLHRLADQTDGWQHSLFELWREFSALGFAGLLVPTDYQGMGCSLSDAAILAETLGAYLTPLPFIEHQLCCLAITLAGSPEQKQMWLPKLASGECVGTVAFHSGDGGFHPTSWTLCKDDSGETQLKFCPSLGISDVPHLVVTGMHNGELALIAPDDLQLTPQVPSTMDLTRYLAAVRFAKPQ